MMKTIAEFDMIIMRTSETVSAQSCATTLSNTTSGNGPYVFLSGTRSCTIARDAVVNMKFTTMKRNAVTGSNDSENERSRRPRDRHMQLFVRYFFRSHVRKSLALIDLVMQQRFAP